MLQTHWKTMPSSSLSHGFINVTENALLSILDEELVMEYTEKPLYDVVVVERIDSKKIKTVIEDGWIQCKGGRLNTNVVQGSLWRFLFGETLGGKFKHSTITEHLNSNGKVESKKDRHILTTTIQTNGFSVNCLVIDTETLKKRGLKDSDKSLLDSAKDTTKRKKFKSDVLDVDEKDRIKSVVGMDFGQVCAIAACKKDLDSYEVKDRILKVKFDGKENNVPLGKFLTMKEKSEVVNLAITTKALGEPTKLYLRWLAHQKEEPVVWDKVYEE
jgi:hypothetical protein